MSPRSTAWARAAGLATALGLCACGADNTLEGSISREYSLAFDAVAISKTGCQLKIAYVRRSAVALESPCTVTVDTSEADPADTWRIQGQAFLDAVTIKRAMTFPRPFPDVARGMIAFEEYGFDSGDRIEGSFEVVFDDDDALELRGTFAGDLRDAAPDQGC